MGSKALDFRSWSENGGTRTDSVVITPVAPGPLTISSYTVDDDNLGNSSGNGNGRADCGETIELFIELRNSGAGTSLSTAATVSTTDPAATFPFNTSSGYGDIAGGATAVNLDDFDISLDPVMPLAHSLILDLAITASNGGPWNTSLNLPVLCEILFFSDGFESGDTSAWSNTVP
jgi:hypothetical protein